AAVHQRRRRAQGRYPHLRLRGPRLIRTGSNAVRQTGAQAPACVLWPAFPIPLATQGRSLSPEYSMNPWQPTASPSTRRQRARSLRRIRAVFGARRVPEAEAPPLPPAAVSDPRLCPSATDYLPEGGGQAQTLCLHTSPEYPMKRLLAAGSGCIWQLCRVYRNGESGRRHNPEFSMLEWYRVGFDHHRLMDEVDDLVDAVLGCGRSRRVTYAA